jgi:hypothetical protein
MHLNKIQEAVDPDRIVFWNNVKLQQIAKRHNQRLIVGLIVRNVPTILRKESLSTIANVIANIVCGKNVIAWRPYSPVINRDKVQGGRHVRTNYAVQESAGIHAGAGFSCIAQ